MKARALILMTIVLGVFLLLGVCAVMMQSLLFKEDDSVSSPSREVEPIRLVIGLSYIGAINDGKLTPDKVHDWRIEFLDLVDRFGGMLILANDGEYEFEFRTRQDMMHLKARIRISKFSEYIEYR